MKQSRCFAFGTGCFVCICLCILFDFEKNFAYYFPTTWVLGAFVSVVPYGMLFALADGRKRLGITCAAALIVLRIAYTVLNRFDFIRSYDILFVLSDLVPTTGCMILLDILVIVCFLRGQGLGWIFSLAISYIVILISLLIVFKNGFGIEYTKDVLQYTIYAMFGKLGMTPRNKGQFHSFE